MGIGTDGWAVLQKRLFEVPSHDYRLVGRWIGHFPEGRFIHDGIGKAAAVRGEIPLGWAIHYAIGIAFAGVFIDWPAWLRNPILLPAPIASFFVMQPAFGAGIAASRMPKPWLSRFRSFVAHTSVAIGLFPSELLLSLAAA